MTFPSHYIKIFYIILAFSIPFIIYVTFLCPVIAGGDSPELITASYVLGVPHPPGYPIYTIVAGIFTFLPAGSIAWRVNLMSAFFNGLCCMFVFLTLEKIIKNPLPALAGVLFLASSRYFWHYSEVAEVFPLNNFFVSLLIYLLISWREKLSEMKPLYLFSFFYGLSLTNHHTIILLAIPFLFFILCHQRKLKVLLICSLLFFLGLLPYIYLPVAAGFSPPLNWKNPVTFQSFKALVFRENYGSLSLLSTKTLEDLNIVPPHRINQIYIYFSSLYPQFTIIGLLAGLMGLVSFGFNREYRDIYIFFLSSFLFTGPFFSILANVPVQVPLLFGVLQRFYIMPSIIFAYWIGIGFNFISKGPERKFPKYSVAISGLLFFILLLFPFCSNLDEADFRTNYLAYDYGKNILSGLPKNSILFLKGDLPSMTVDYLQMVENFRTDVKVIDQRKLYYDWYVFQVRKRFPEIVIPGVYDKKSIFNIDLISENIDKFSIFFTDFEERSFEDKFKIFPYGLVWKVIPKNITINTYEIEKQQKELINNFILRGVEGIYSPFSWEFEIKRQYQIHGVPLKGQ